MRRPLLVIALLAALVPPANATVQSPTVGISQYLPAEYAAIDHRVGELRSAMSSGSLAAALQAVIEQRPEWEITSPIVDAAPVPGSVQEAVTSLDAAVTQARALLEGPGTPHDPRDAHRASLLIMQAVDLALPVLAASGPSAPSAIRTSVDGCDLVDELPNLCVGSDADNVYRDDVALLIDLGGDDRYENAAGGAPFSAEDGQVFPVSVNIDVAGDDLYTGSSPHPEAPETLLGQGAAYGSRTVGLLVDATGNDQYALVSPPERPGTSILGQATALGSAVAGLFDLSGNDHYLARVNPGETAESAGVQGYAVQSAAAVLSDSGGGNDVYEADAGTALMDEGWNGAASPSAGAVGQGMAATASSAVVFDDGGTDSFLLRAAAMNHRLIAEADGSDPPLVPSAGVGGQGFAQTATASLLTGPGPTTYRMEVLGVGTASVTALGQGTGFAPGGLGVVDDLGGDDSYSIELRQELQRTIEVDDSCRSGGTTCAHAEASVANPIDAWLDGQGAGWTGGSGMVQDHAGNDEFHVSLEQRATVTLHDRLSNPSASPKLSVTGFRRPKVLVQGAADGGTGMLIELGGTDRYSLEVEQATSARTSSVHASGTPRVVALQQGGGDIAAQGSAVVAGESLFVDAAGSGDRVESVVSVEAHSAPDPAGGFARMAAWPAVQGAGLNSQFAVLGTDATVRSSPSRPACPAGSEGYRGFGTWIDCPSPAGASSDPDHQNFEWGGPQNKRVATGAVPSATGAKPSLAFTPDTPTTAPVDNQQKPAPGAKRLAVGALLRDPAGNPLASEIVHFTLQEFVGTFWVNEWQVDSVTGSDGIARASLPLSGWSNLDGDPWRIVASFDGGPGLYPRHVASPLTPEA